MPNEQVKNDNYKPGSKYKVFVVEVANSVKGVHLVVSRSHPGLVRRLFELEVPEIAQNTVVIKNIAREAGHRTKISVYADDMNIDPVGACVGPRGSRIDRIVGEIGNERIDVIPWSSDPAEYIVNALRPAKVIMCQVNPEEKAAKVVVPDYQLSLAIGKEGQNARLAAKLTGYKIDIKSQSQIVENVFNDDYEEYDEEDFDTDLEFEE
jgi:N utilization substance protein A